MEMKTSEKEKAGNEQLQDAIDSIAVIRSVFERASVNMRSLAPLLISMGGAQLLLTLLRAVIMINLSQQSLGIASVVFRIVGYVIAAAIFVMFLVMRGRLNRTENSYTMKLYNMWGLVMFGIYPLSLATSLVVSILPRFTAYSFSDNALIVFPVLNIVQLAIVCMALFFTGLLGEKKPLMIFSAALLFVFVLIFGMNMPFIMDDIKIYSALSAYSYLTLRGSLANIIVNLVFLILGVCFAVKRGGVENGDN